MPSTYRRIQYARTRVAVAAAHIAYTCRHLASPLTLLNTSHHVASSSSAAAAKATRWGSKLPPPKKSARWRVVVCARPMRYVTSQGPWSSPPSLPNVKLWPPPDCCCRALVPPLRGLLRSSIIRVRVRAVVTCWARSVRGEMRPRTTVRYCMYACMYVRGRDPANTRSVRPLFPARSGSTRSHAHQNLILCVLALLLQSSPCPCPCLCPSVPSTLNAMPAHLDNLQASRRVQNPTTLHPSSSVHHG